MIPMQLLRHPTRYATGGVGGGVDNVAGVASKLIVSFCQRKNVKNNIHYYHQGSHYLSTSSNQPLKQQLPPGYSFKSKTQSKTKQGKIVPRRMSSYNLVLKAGLPLVFFSILASWVVSKAIDGKLREKDASEGKVSLSIRQAAVDKEHDEMIERINTIVKQDFDNTKRIKRPEEILEERRRERQRRNVWYRRFHRWITNSDDQKNKNEKR